MKQMKQITKIFIITVIIFFASMSLVMLVLDKTPTDMVKNALLPHEPVHSDMILVSPENMEQRER